MVCETFVQKDTPVRRLDPRGRVLAALAFSVLLAISFDVDVLLGGLTVGLLAAVAAQLPIRATLKRFAAVNIFVLLVAVVLPYTTSGTVLFHLGPLAFTREGAVRAGIIALKANAIVLLLTALLSTIELTRLGRALRALGVPPKLAQLFFFTVRYLDVLHHEYRRLRNAMRVRCFRPGMNMHTYRTMGYLVGMLLVKSFDRSERILAAMKCRGFNGEFHVLKELRFRGRDAIFGVLVVVALCGLLGLELI